MKKRIISILLNQFFLSIIITIVIVLFLPDYFSKYQIELKSQTVVPKNGTKVYFEDLNNDNVSEKVYAYNNTDGKAGFEIHNYKNELINQWNYLSEYPKEVASICFLDMNANGYKEICLITKRRDSLFLNIIEPLIENGIDIKNIFIDKMAIHNGEFDANVSIYCNFQNKITTVGEVFLNINAGFSGYPRNTYKYNFKTNTIYKSPHLTNHSSIDYIISSDNEEKTILYNTYAPDNKIDTIYTKRTDNSSWFWILNNDLNFLFEPIEFKNPYFKLNAIPFNFKNDDRFICLANSRRDADFPDKLCIYTNTGKLIKEVALSSGDYFIFPSNKSNEITLFNSNLGGVQIFDESLQKINSFSINQDWRLYKADFDDDGEMEWLNISKDLRTCSIYRTNFKDPINFEIPMEYNNYFKFGIKKNKQALSDIYFQKGDYFFIYSYTKNSYYFLKYVQYPIIYLLVLGLAWLIIKGQTIRNEKKLAIEKEIAELQLKTIKNQVDPHFVFNAMNTISEMMLTDNKLEADRFICKFSDLMRKTLQKSDKISCSLKEEIEYVTNYMQLQQIRFKNSFEFIFYIDDNVNLEVKVPKHVLYTYIENAIKHGLSTTKNGVLKISVKQDKNLVIEVEDNGGGINPSKNTIRNSTGNGIKIMENIYKLYAKLYNKKIEHKIEEIIDEHHSTTGLRVVITIFN